MSDRLLATRSLFQKKWLIISVLISLLLFQLIYSFSFPACDFSDNWLPVDAYLPKFTAETTDNLLLEKLYPLISSQYRLNSDVGNYLELAQNFDSQHFENHIYLNRPLYPFLIFLSSLPIRPFVSPSYGIIFGLAILVNFILMGLAVLLFFWLLKDLFSFKVAWLSSVLLIFSPLTHSLLVQPLIEMLAVLAVVVSSCLLYKYIKNPSTLKLIVFSLIIGTLLLGKMFFATSFFILLLALYSRRYKEGVIFLMVHLIPFGLWYLWTTQIWQINYGFSEVQTLHMGTWILNVFQQPWQETLQILLGALPNFITALIYAFLLIPVIFSIVGLNSLPFKERNIIYFGSVFSVFVLCFTINYYFYRHAFLLFPVIYPTAVLGIDKTANFLKRYQPRFYQLFYAIVIGLIIFISNINIYQVFNYNGEVL